MHGNQAGSGSVAGALNRASAAMASADRPLLVTQVEALQKQADSLMDLALGLENAANRLKAEPSDGAAPATPGVPPAASLENRLSGVHGTLSEAHNRIVQVLQRLDRAV